MIFVGKQDQNSRANELLANAQAETSRRRNKFFLVRELILLPFTLVLGFGALYIWLFVGRLSFSLYSPHQVYTAISIYLVTAIAVGIFFWYLRRAQFWHRMGIKYRSVEWVEFFWAASVLSLATLFIVHYILEI